MFFLNSPLTVNIVSWELSGWGVQSTKTSKTWWNTKLAYHIIIYYNPLFWYIYIIYNIIYIDILYIFFSIVSTVFLHDSPISPKKIHRGPLFLAHRQSPFSAPDRTVAPLCPDLLEMPFWRLGIWMTAGYPAWFNGGFNRKTIGKP